MLSRHRHRWLNVALDPNWEKPTPTGGKQPQTLVLQRCRCGAHETQLIMGTWSREDLGIDDEKIRDLLTLLGEFHDND